MRHEPIDSVLETEPETGPEKVPAKVRFPCVLGVVAPESAPHTADSACPAIIIYKWTPFPQLHGLGISNCLPYRQQVSSLYSDLPCQHLKYHNDHLGHHSHHASLDFRSLCRRLHR